VTVSNQASHDIGDEAGEAPMTRVFNLRDVFQLIGDGFENATLAQQQLVFEPDQAVLHVGLEFGDEGDAALVELLGQGTDSLYRQTAYPTGAGPPDAA